MSGYLALLRFRYRRRGRFVSDYGRELVSDVIAAVLVFLLIAAMWRAFDVFFP